MPEDVSTSQCFCNQKDILACPSTTRIIKIIKTFNHTVFENIEEINNLFYDGYTTSGILNDFYHLKYLHKVDEDNNEFHKIFEHLNSSNDIICNPKCKFVERYCIDRRMLTKEYALVAQNLDNRCNLEYQLTLQLISRIHVYFMHSNDGNSMLSPTQKHEIEKKLNEFESDNYDEKEEKQLEAVTEIMCSSRSCFSDRNNTKFMDNVLSINKMSNVLNFAMIHQILQKNGIQTNLNDIQSAFSNYNNKNQFISDLIDARYGLADQSSPLENQMLLLSKDYETRKSVYEKILFGYIQNHELDGCNFTKIAMRIIDNFSYQINQDEFKQQSISTNISGTIFMKGTSTYKNSLKFAKIFKSVIGFKKKEVANIYNLIKEWNCADALSSPKQTQHNENTDNCTPKKQIHKNDTDIEHMYVQADEKQSQKEEETRVYEFGTRFYFWDCMISHKHYIKKQHANLKEEMLHSNLIQPLFNLELWNIYKSECDMFLKTDKGKSFMSNGFHQYMYKVKKNTPITIQHLLSIKIYTDDTKLCNIFCSTLR
eukprot:139817_1